MPHLRAAGHDAVHALAVGLCQASDSQMLEAARHQGRIVITADLDSRASRPIRRALERDRQNPVVLNDLAYALVQGGGMLDEALTLAEQAYRRARGNASFGDTPGFILCQKELLDRAEPLLVEAAWRVPKNPVIRTPTRTNSLRSRPAVSRRAG